MSANGQYSDGVIAGMQMLYGHGFLSPGGPSEVDQLLSGIDPAGMRVLDMGCGLGGCAVKLVHEYGVDHVTGIDIEYDLVSRATAAVDAAGLQARIDIRQVEPGRLPIDEHSFDLVITKDVVCHIADKTAVFAEIFRVLKPGGSYLCADFFDASHETGPGHEAHTFYHSYVGGMKAYGLSFHFEAKSSYENALVAAGLDLHQIRDHTEISAEVAAREHAFLNSGESGAVNDALGEERFHARVNATAMRLKALQTRGLQHGHLHAGRPA